MNNKGFMMAEVVVVSSIVLVALVGLYTSYNKIFTIYNQRVNYYDVATLYRLAYIRDYYQTNGWSLEDVSSQLVSGEKVGYIGSSEFAIEAYASSDINQTFKEYLNFLLGSTAFETPNILVMEKCDDDGKTNCKYAYLEVFEDAS